MGLQFFRYDKFLSFLGIRRIIPCLCDMDNELNDLNFFWQFVPETFLTMFLRLIQIIFLKHNSEG